MRVLVIGGTRFIGPRVVRRLVKAGHEVGVFYRGEHEVPLPGGVRRFKHHSAAMPVTHIPAELKAYAPETVLHMIAMGQADGAAACKGFCGIARRIVMLSSGDVYRAYGVFKRSEPGPIEQTPLNESAPLRSNYYLYRTDETPTDALEYYYDKILAERALSADSRLPATILRLPKIYGPEDNGDLATVYGFRHRPDWRWTHGYVENVAQAIVQAIENNGAAGRTYNVGEEVTPSVAERLEYLPPNPAAQISNVDANFAQDVVYDTSRIRKELGYREESAEREAMRKIATASMRVRVPLTANR